MKPLLFTYALTYGGAVVSLFNPFYGLLIYVCFAIIKPDALWSWAIPQGNYSRVVAIGLLVGWGLNGFGSWRLGRARGILAALVGFWCWSATGASFASVDSGAAWDQVEEYAKILLPFLVGITTIRSLRQLKQLAWVIALSEGYLAYEFNLLYWNSPFFDPREWSFAGLDNNGIAITMVASAGFTFFLGLYASRWWQKLLALGLSALMAHVVLFSMSRGGMLALILTGVAVFVLIPKRPAHVFVVLVALAVGWRLAGTAVVERFETTFQEEKDYSARSRVELWGACVKVMVDNPVVGIGANNWRLVAHHYGFTEGKDAHTTWLHVGAELGAVGLLFLASFYGLCVVRLWRLARGQPPLDEPWFRTFAHMGIASIVGFAVSAQFVSVYAVELPFYIVLVGAGALKLSSLGWGRRAGESAADPGGSLPPAPVVPSAVAHPRAAEGQP